MGYVEINPNVYDHPSVISLPSRALWAWVASICWLSRNGRAEAFPAALDRTFKATPRVRQALLLEQLWVDHDATIEVPQIVHGRWSRPMRLWKFGPLATSRPKIPPMLRAAVYARDGHACRRCGSTERLSLDHVHPFSLGGSDTFENLQTLCQSCNSSKGARV